MATTDTKPGFKLPWSSERSETGSATDGDPSADGQTTQTDQENETPEMIDATPAATDPEAAVETPAAPADTPAVPQAAASTPDVSATTGTTTAATAGRKPNKFMADLTKAMQVAAEAAREDTLARFNADAKAYIESIHADSATEAADLRKQADDDIAGIRDWSKAEIARIREETDDRIARRKSTLEQEVEEHAAAIEARIERVQGRVTSFEEEMAAFFERLLAEEDPTRFAAMAESLPEPPPFDGPAPAKAAAPAPASEHDEPTAEGTTAAVDATSDGAAADIDPEAIQAAAEAAHASAEAAHASAEAAQAAADAAQATAESLAEPNWPSADAAPATDEDAGLFGITGEEETDPRLAALGLSPDFAAAEAEAAAFTADGEDAGEPIPEIGDDAIAARLAGLVPEGDAAPAAPVTTTRVVVTGLISVASIAGFKRHLSRAAGVQSVGVSSGPDGEFVFAVGHGTDISLRDIIPTLPGFAARITAEGDGQITVAAQDPEAEA